MFISGYIIDEGAWDAEAVTSVMKMVDTYPDAVFLDIGSNIGMYTVMIAAMDRKVFAVDPMIFNLQLIHESLKKSGKTKYVNLINSPIRYTGGSRPKNIHFYGTLVK